MERLFPVLCNTQKTVGNYQKPKCSSSIVTEAHNFKMLPFFLHGYHTRKLKNIAILAIAFSPHNFKIFLTCHMEFFCVSNGIIHLNFFWRFFGRNYVSIIIAIISNMTVLVPHSVICFGYFLPLSRDVNKRAPTTVSPTPLLNQV